MNKLSILFLMGFAHLVNGQNKNEIIKNVLQTCKGLKNYDIQFERTFKHIQNSDTLFEESHSIISKKGEDNYTGNHTIQRHGIKNEKLRIACNDNELVSLNLTDSVYFNLKSDFKDPARLEQEKQKFLYYPITRKKSDYKNFEIAEANTEHIQLKYISDFYHPSTGKTTHSLIIITINSKTFFPEMEESWMQLGNGIQYSKYKVIACHSLADNTSKSIKKTTDSLIVNSKRFISGDSLRESRKPIYKEVKNGDKAFLFNAVVHGTNDSFRMTDHSESIVVLDFFYTTCGPCAASVPHLLSVYHRYQEKGVKMFGLDPFEADWGNLNKYGHYFKIDYPLLKGEKQIALEYGVKGYPKLFIIKNGVIMKIFDGYTEDLEKDLEKELNKLIKQ